MDGTKMELKTILQFFCHFIPLVREQVGVGIESGFHLLVPQTVCYGYRGKTKLNQQAGVAVPEVMDADRFYA